MLLQTLGGYADSLALLLGVLAVLVVLVLAWSTRHAGREGDERAHEKAVTRGLRGLDGTQQAYLHPGRDDGYDRADWVDDIQALPTWGQELRRHRLRNWLRRRRGRWGSAIYAQGRSFEDADGRPLLVVSVNGHRLANRDSQALADDAETVAAAIEAGDRIPPTVSEYFYDDIREGRVDLQRSRSRIHGDCLTRAKANLKREENLPQDELVERFVYDFRYPKDIVERVLGRLLGRELRITKDGTVKYQRYS